MAAGDQLDQVLAQLDAQDQERKKRRVPAPQVLPVTAASGRAAASTPPSGGPTFLSGLKDAAISAVDKVLPGVGSALGLVAQHPEVASGIGAGVLRSPVTAAAGLADFGADVAHAASPHLDPRSYSASITPAGVAFRYAPTSDTYSRFARDINPVAHVGNETANEVSSQVASLAVGYGAGAKLAEAAGLAPALAETVAKLGNPVARTAAAMAIRTGGFSAVDAMLMDPETERFSNILQNVGVHTEFTDWLAHKDGEGHLEGRFKNAVEGAVGSVAAESLMGAARYWRARFTGDNATADAIQKELAAKHDGQVPDYTTTEVPPSAAKPQEPGYVGGWEDAPDGTTRPVYEEDPAKGAPPEVKAAAEDSGVEQVEGEKGSTGGPVQPMDPKRMAAAMNDPNAAGGEGIQSPIVSFNVKRTPDDPGVDVGPIDRGSIDSLAHDIEDWRGTRAAEGERSVDVTDPSPTATAHGEFRLGNIGSQEGVAPLLRAVVDRLPEMAPRSDAELMADAGRASAEIGEDPASLLEAARLISGKLSDADTAMVTLRTVWARAAEDLDTLPETDWESAPQDQVDQAAQRIYNMLAISSHVQEAKAGLGRGLRVNQLPDADTYLNTVRKADIGPEPTYGADGPLPRTRQEVKDWFELWRSTKDEPELRAALLEGALTRIIPSAGKYLRNSFANFFTGSILSAPRTLLLNLIGPAFMSIVRNVERQSGSMIAAVNPFLSATDRAAALQTARYTSTAYLQTFGDIADTMRWAWKAAQQNKTVIGGGQTIDTQAAFGPWTPELVQAARPDTGPIASTVYSLGNAINLWPRAIQRINNGFDEFSKRLAYLGEVRVRALQEAGSQGLGGEGMAALVKERLQGAFNEAGHATDDGVLREAERTTLTYKTGEEGGKLRGLYDYINTVRRDIPEFRYLLPVLGVPANTLGEALRRLPIAAMPGFNRILYKTTADELAGVYGPIRQADAHGRMISGASFLAGGIMLNQMGVLTGAGPQNPTDRKVWLLEHQPYSIRIGDKWVRYDKYDVLGGLLSIPATIRDATINVAEDQTYSDMILSGVGALAQWFKDRAALRGATGLLALGDDPTSQAGNVFKQAGGSILQGMVPNMIQAPITQAVDPYQRMRRNWSDYMEAAIPGLSAQLPPVRNVLGERIQRPANSVGEGLFPVTIAPAVTFKEDPVVDEIDRLYQATGYGAGADPKSIGYGFFNPKDVALENGQSLYDAFMQARLTMRVNGLTLRQSLGKLFGSADYGKAVDADPGQKVTSRGDASRGYMVQQTFETYNKRIKAELAQSSPTANLYLTAAAAKQRDDAYLKDANVEDLVHNPSLYQAHGIDPALYSAKVRQGATGALADALRSR